MGVQAYFVSDDDGSRQTRRGTAAEAAQDVATWVDKTNSIYSKAGIHLDFDPAAGAGDWADLQSTLINSMTGVEHPDWEAQKAAANAQAALTPDKMVAYLRWGDGASRTGGAFSWTDYNFIAMPDFDSTTVCGHQNLGILAHEGGHYLGLAHTHGQSLNPSTIAAAEAFYVDHGRNPYVFDGDGRADTPPDPYTNQTACDQAITSINLDGDTFVLPRRNIMSYYDFDASPGGGDITTSQAWTMRSTVLLRSGQSLTNLVLADAEEPDEGEDFNYHVTSGFATDQSMTSFLGKWSGNQQVFWKNGAIGSQLSFNFSAPADGQYNVYASFTSASDYGIFDHIINGQTAETSLDLYSRGVLPTGLVDLGVFDLSAGSNQWIAKIAGRNPDASPGNAYGLDFLMIAPVLLPGDINMDGRLDEEDVAAFVAGWQKVLPTDDDRTAWSKGDLNLDHVSDLYDAFLLHQAFTNAGMSVDLDSLIGVPEPGSAGLSILLIIAGFIRSARTRKRGRDGSVEKLSLPGRRRKTRAAILELCKLVSWLVSWMDRQPHEADRKGLLAATTRGDCSDASEKR